MTISSYHLPFSFFNLVFFSKSVAFNEEIKHIIHHELTHIKSRHSLDVCFLELLHILFWWNPLVYLYKKEIRQVHEYFADAMVLTETNQKIYGQILLGQSESGLEVALAHQFFHSHLKQRIMMMYKQKSGKSAIAKYLVAIPVILCLCILFSFTNSNFAAKEPDRLKFLMDEYFASDTVEDWDMTSQQQLTDGDYQIKKGAFTYMKGLIDEFPEQSLLITQRFSFEASLNGYLLTFNNDSGDGFCSGWDERLNNKLNEFFNRTDLTKTLLINKRATLIQSHPKYTSLIQDRFTHELKKVKKVEAVTGISQKSKLVNTKKQQSFNLKGEIPKRLTSATESNPRFPGCKNSNLSDSEQHNCTMQLLLDYVSSNVSIPKKAKVNGVEGLNIVKIFIDKNGKLYDYKIVKNLEFGTGEVTESFLDQLKNEITWIPAMKNGTPVNGEIIFPIRFSLGEEIPLNNSFSISTAKNPSYPSLHVSDNYGPHIHYHVFTKNRTDNVIAELRTEDDEVLDSYQFTPVADEFSGRFKIDRTSEQSYFIHVKHGAFESKKPVPVYKLNNNPKGN